MIWRGFSIIFCYGEIIFDNGVCRDRLHKSSAFEIKERLTFGKSMI